MKFIEFFYTQHVSKFRKLYEITLNCRLNIGVCFNCFNSFIYQIGIYS